MPGRTSRRRWFAVLLLVAVMPWVWADGNAEPEPVPAVSGTVTDSAGAPVAGATVWVRVKNQSIRSKHRNIEAWVDPVSVVSDEQGRFSATIDAEGELHLFFAHPEHPSTAYPPPVKAGSSIDLAFPGALTFKGQVLSRDGKPVANADVLACRPLASEFGPETCLETRTDSDGNYRFERLADGTFLLQAWAPGHALSAVARLKLPQEEGVDPLPDGLRLDPGAEVSGSVTDDSGTALAGVRVEYRTDRVRLGQVRGVTDTQPLSIVFTDEQGQFAFRGVPAGQRLKMVAAASKRRMAESDGLTLEAGAVIGGVSIVQKRRASAKVHLTDRDGQPITALEVLWMPVKEGAPQANSGFRMAGIAATEVEAQGEGSFRITEIKPGLCNITLLPEGHREIEIQDVEVPPGTEIDLGTRVAQPGVVFSGYVVDDLGLPVEDAKIETTYLRDNAAMSRSTRSRSDGTFVLGGLVEGPLLWLKGSADGHAETMTQGVASDQTGYEIVLERVGTVTGRVTLVSGDPPEQVQATLEDASGGIIRARRGDGGSASGDAEGRFEIKQAGPGSYSLRLTAKGARPLRVKDVVVQPGVPTDIGTHRLSEGLRFRGMVVDARDGGPIAGATVRVDSAGGGLLSEGGELGTAVTDTDGAFEVGGLEPGRLVVRAEHAEFAPGKEEANLPEDEPAEDLTIRLGQGGSLRGTVRDSSGQPSAERALGIIEGGGFIPGDGMVRTNDAGEYFVERMRPGSYRVMLYPDAMANGMNIQQKAATIREGEETVVDFDATTKITFQGRLLRGGQPVGDVNVILIPSEAGGLMQTRSASVDLSGRFEVGLDRAGGYTVMVQDLNKGMSALVGQAKIVVPDETNVSQDIVLQSGSISGTVLDGEGRPIEGSAVAAALEGARMDDFGSNTGAMVDPDGTFRIEGVNEGTYTLTAIADGYQVSTHSVTVSGSTPIDGLEFRLERAGELRGRVVDEFGNGVSGAYVFASVSGSNDFNSSIPSETDAEGFFRVSAPSDGPCDIEASAGGLAPGRVVGIQPAQAPHDPGPVITLTKGGSILVRVLNAAGEAVEGAQPSIQPDRPSQGLAMTLLFSPPPPTDDGGGSRIGGLPPGAYRVSVAGQGSVPAQAVTVTEGAETVVTLQVP